MDFIPNKYNSPEENKTLLGWVAGTVITLAILIIIFEETGFTDYLVGLILK